MNKQKSKQKGITLIALVVTIIVLIILAGVSISLIVGDNGIITMAQLAKGNTELAQKEEQENLNILQYTLETGNIVLVDKTVEEVKSEGTYMTSNTQIKDNRGNTIVIPAGFKIASDSGINVADGIVIEDKDISLDGKGEQRGNQFVWVPVSNINEDGSGKIIKTDGTQVEITLGRYTFAEDGTENLIQSAENYEEKTTLVTYYHELVEFRIANGSGGLDATNTTAKDLKGFIDSVQINHGYYIARYEASYKDGKVPYSKVSTGTPASTDSTAIITGMLWNYITQPEAAEAAKKMYEGNSFESDLINSYAWDTAVVYIQKCSGDTDYARQSSLNATLSNTGVNGDERCKINDMASNVREWTTEYSTRKDETTAYAAVESGGQCGDTQGTTYTGNRWGLSPLNRSWITTFRTILYL